MANFIWKLFEGKKKPRGYGDNNQSMIDLIFENGDHNDTFRSHQPHIDRSFSLPDEDLSHPTDRSDIFSELPPSIGQRTNIVSVLNTPRQTSLLEDLYGIFQEQILDQLGEMIGP